MDYEESLSFGYLQRFMSVQFLQHDDLLIMIPNHRYIKVHDGYAVRTNPLLDVCCDIAPYLPQASCWGRANLKGDQENGQTSSPLQHQVHLSQSYSIQYTMYTLNGMTCGLIRWSRREWGLHKDRKVLATLHISYNIIPCLHQPPFLKKLWKTCITCHTLRAISQTRQILKNAQAKWGKI